MAKRFSSEENYAIFNTVVYEGLEKHDWGKLYKDCRGATLNKKKINTYIDSCCGRSLPLRLGIGASRRKRVPSGRLFMHSTTSSGLFFFTMHPLMGE